MLLPSKQYTDCPVLFISTSQHFTQGQISHIERVEFQGVLVLCGLFNYLYFISNQPL